MPNSFRIPEGGPVDVMDSDEALLATRPSPKDYGDSELVVLDLPETKLSPIQQAVEFVRTLPDRAMEYAVRHPAAMHPDGRQTSSAALILLHISRRASTIISDKI